MIVPRNFYKFPFVIPKIEIVATNELSIILNDVDRLLEKYGKNFPDANSRDLTRGRTRVLGVVGRFRMTGQAKIICYATAKRNVRRR